VSDKFNFLFQLRSHLSPFFNPFTNYSTYTRSVFCSSTDKIASHYSVLHIYVLRCSEKHLLTTVLNFYFILVFLDVLYVQ
jgi:hypothetical protein